MCSSDLAGPSSWEVRGSALGLDGNALFQGSNIWGSPGDTMLMGTFLVYTGEEYIDFILEIDVAAGDNDAMGLVWAYTDTDQHYRVNIINDGWPSPPLDGNSGPMAIMHKRISDDDPWYDLIEVAHPPDYSNYPENGERMHWTLEVSQGQFTFTNDNADAADPVVLEGEDTDYQSGFIGIQLYAQQSEFDNVTIVSTYPVDPNGKVATSWGALREAR